MKKILFISVATLLMCFFTLYIKAQSTYTYNGSGALNSVNNWTPIPPDFTSPNQIFVVTNVSSTTLSAAGWTVSGSGSEIRIGDGSSSTKLTVASDATLMVSGDAKLRVQNNGTLNLRQSNLNYLPSSGDVIIDNGSTVEWAQTSAVNVWPLNYWNFTLLGANKYIPAYTSMTVQSQYNNPNDLILYFNYNNLSDGNNSLYILGDVIGNLVLISSKNTTTLVIGGTSTSSINITLPLYNQIFGRFELNRNSLVKWNKSIGAWVAWYSCSVTTGTIDITGFANGHILYLYGSANLGATWRSKNTLVMDFRGSGSISGNLNFESGFNSLNTLILNKSGQTLSLGTPLDIYSDVNVVRGTLSTNGNLTLKSNATQKARINVLDASADVIGNVTVETFAKGGYTGWTNLAVAGVTGQTMASGWGDDFPMTCPSGCPNGSTAGGVPFTSVTTYNETSNTYPGITSGSDPITPGVGYWVYLGNGQTTTTDILIDVTGPIVKKAAGSWNFTKTTGAGNGWNLVGNPYPSPISFAKAFGSYYGSGQMANELRVWNPDLNNGNGDYALYKVGVGSTPPVASGGIDDNIPTGQAFYIIANQAFSIPWSENFKTTTASTNPLLRTMNNENTQSNSPQQNRLFYLHLTGSGANTYAGIHFNSNATISYNSNFDAEQIDPYPGAPQVFSVVGNKELKVKGLPYPNGTLSLDIKVRSGISGTYTLSLEGMEDIPAGACLTLFDKFTNTTHNLLSSPYVFNFSDTTTISRFVLNITMNQLSNLSTSILSTPQCHNQNTGAIVASMGTGSYNFVWKDINNQIIKTTNNVNKDTLKNVGEGYYFVEVNDGNCSNITNTVQIIANTSVPTIDFTTGSDTVPVNTPVLFTNTSQNLSNFEWDFGDGGTDNSVNAVHTFTNPGNYLVILTGMNSCGDTLSTLKEIIVMTSTQLNPNGVPVSPVLQVSRDVKGYYITANYTKDTKVNILVSDILGRQIIKETITLGNNKRFYLDHLPENQIIVIRAEDGYNIINQKVFVEK
jgi:PKD repeat protein